MRKRNFHPHSNTNCEYVLIAFDKRIQILYFQQKFSKHNQSKNNNIPNLR